MKMITPAYYFDLQVPAFDEARIDVCYSEWRPIDVWFPEQSTAQRFLLCDQVTYWDQIGKIQECEDNVILVETSLEVIPPRLLEFRAALMAEVYRKHFVLNRRWQAVLDNMPTFDIGIHVRRGDLLAYVPEARFNIDQIVATVNALEGSKVIVSDDLLFQNEVRFRCNAVLGFEAAEAAVVPSDYDFIHFLQLSKCRVVYGTPGSSFAEQAAFFGGKPYHSIKVS